MKTSELIITGDISGECGCEAASLAPSTLVRRGWMPLTFSFKPKNFHGGTLFRLSYTSTLENRSADERMADALLARLMATSLRNNPVSSH